MSKIEPKAHVNTLDVLLPNLRKREGVLILKRLTIELDGESEKGFGLTQASTHLFNSYDIISLRPTTPSTLSLACLTHTAPSSLTAHIISLPLTSPQSLRLKHTLVRTAIKNGAVFEIEYSGALEDNDSERRNWWAGAREITRVTKGKSIVVSGGSESYQLLRAPRDAGNLLTLTGLAQDQAHHAATTTPKSLILRAQTRRTYRAILSEPKLIMPESNPASASADVGHLEIAAETTPIQHSEVHPSKSPSESKLEAVEELENMQQNPVAPTPSPAPEQSSSANLKGSAATPDSTGKKRTRDQLNLDELGNPAAALQETTSKTASQNDQGDGGRNRKRKKKGKDKA